MTSLVDEQGFNQGYALTKAQNRRLARRTEAMLAEMGAPFSRTVRILELGCGTGEVACLLAKMPNVTVVGMDRSPLFIRQAETSHAAPNLSFVTADIVTDIGSIAEESCEFVVGNGVLHHVHADLNAVLSNLRRILKPGGKLIFWEPNYLNPYIFGIFTFAPLRRLARLEPAEMAFSPGLVAGKLRALGMSETRVDTRDFLLPNTPDFLIGTAIGIGGALEKIPGVRAWAQSLFIVSIK